MGCCFCYDTADKILGSKATSPWHKCMKHIAEAVIMPFYSIFFHILFSCFAMNWYIL